MIVTHLRNGRNINFASVPYLYNTSLQCVCISMEICENKLCQTYLTSVNWKCLEVNSVCTGVLNLIEYKYTRGDGWYHFPSSVHYSYFLRHFLCFSPLSSTFILSLYLSCLRIKICTAISCSWLTLTPVGSSTQNKVVFVTFITWFITMVTITYVKVKYSL